MAGQSRPATVYPYVTPPPNAPHDQGAYHPDPHASQQRTTNGWNVIILAWSLSIGVYSLIIWQIWLANIANPRFYLQTLTVSNFSISSFAGINQFSGVWDAQFIVRNPNSKINIYCDHIQVAVLSHRCSISKTTVPPFVQGTKHETAVRARSTSSGVYVYDQDHLVAHERSKGAIKITVWLMVRVKPSPLGSYRTDLRVLCPDLRLVISSKGDAGSVVGGLKKCMVSDFWFGSIGPPRVGHCTLFS